MTASHGKKLRTALQRKANAPYDALQESVLADSIRVKDGRSKDWVFATVHILVNENPMEEI